MSGRLWRSVRACVESSAPSASAFPQALHANPLPSALREVKIETIDHTECVDDYSSLELTVTDRMFCGMGAGKDSCQVRRQAVTSVASPVGLVWIGSGLQVQEQYAGRPAKAHPL